MTSLAILRCVRCQWTVPFVLALVLMFAPVYHALAEAYNAVEGPWTLSTEPYTTPIGGGGFTYKARSSTTSSASVSTSIELRGFNNGGGWHQTQRTSCSGGSSCYAGDIFYDYSLSPDSTDRYATAGHNVTSGGTIYSYYTSSDGTRSSYNCLVVPGC